MSISSKQRDSNEGGGERWKEIIGQAKVDEARARAAAANASADQALLEREKWMYEKQKLSQSANMSIQLERMQRYKEMKSLGFNDDVIGEMVEDLRPLIESIRRHT